MARADRVEDAGRAARGERIEVGRSRRLVRRPPAVARVRAVRDPVEEQDDDRMHGRKRLDGNALKLADHPRDTRRDERLPVAALT
jgi:hypothetical protein